MPLILLILIMFTIPSACGLGPENVDFTEYTLLDQDNSIEVVSSDRVEWNQLNRVSNRSLSTHLGEESLADFMVDFEFCITEIHPSSIEHRVMVVLYSVRRADPGGQLSEVTLYCEQVSNSDEMFRVVFLQGEYNEYDFVDLSSILKVNQTYFARIERMDNEIRLKISNEREGVHNSDWRECGPAKFNKIRTVWSIPYPDDSFDYCSGYLQNMELTDFSGDWYNSNDRLELKGHLMSGILIVVTLFTLGIVMNKTTYV